MSRIKRMAGALMIVGALSNIAPAASAAEAEPATHCFPFVDHPVVCMVVCTAQNQSVKTCGVQLACGGDLPTVCFVLGEAWRLVP